MLVEKEKANEKEKEKAINITSSSHSGVLRHISIFFFKRKRSWSGFSIHISKNNVFLHRHMCFSKKIWWLCIELDNPLKKEGAPHSIKKIVSPPFERGYTPSLTVRCTSSKILLEVLSQIHMLLINDFLFFIFWEKRVLKNGDFLDIMWLKSRKIWIYVIFYCVNVC